MLKSTNETTIIVVEGLSSLILAYSNRLASEQYNPGGNTDVSDDVVRSYKEIIKGLRKIREDFEILITGVV